MAKKEAIKGKNNIIYYEDELNDDFARFDFDPKPIKNTWKYKHSNIIYRFFSRFITNVIITPFAYILARIHLRTKVENKKVLKSVKKQGYFIFSNHVLNFDPINHAVLINPFKPSLFPSSHQAFNAKFFRPLISLIGGYPIPNKNDEKMYKNYVEGMKYHINKRKGNIIIYPEGHIWTMYTGIRNFKDNTFKYPVRMNAPVIVATTTFRKNKNGRVRALIHLDGPIYPDSSIEEKEAIKELRDKVYETMLLRASHKYNISYNTYIKKEN